MARVRVRTGFSVRLTLALGLRLWLCTSEGESEHWRSGVVLG